MTKRAYVMLVTALIVVFSVSLYSQSTGSWIGNWDILGTHNFANAISTIPFKTGTTPPASCTTGMVFFDSDETPGLNTKICVSNVWYGIGGAISMASQAEAEAGTENTKAMTALRTAQAFNAMNIRPDPASKSGWIYTSDGTIYTLRHPGDFFRSRMVINEDFLPTFNASTVGYATGRWSGHSAVGGGTFVNTSAIQLASRPGILEIGTSTTNGSDAHVFLGNTSAAYAPFIHNLSTHPYVYSEFSFRTDASQVTRYQGALLGASLPNGAFVQGVGMVATTAAVTCNAGDTSPVTGNMIVYSQDNAGNKWCDDLGFAPANDTWYKFYVEASGGTVVFSVAAGTSSFPAATTIPSNLPTASLTPIFAVKTLAASNVSKIFLDYYTGIVGGMTR